MAHTPFQAPVFPAATVLRAAATLWGGGHLVREASQANNSKLKQKNGGNEDSGWVNFSDSLCRTIPPR
jgi:hypothetical protein